MATPGFWMTFYRINALGKTISDFLLNGPMKTIITPKNIYTDLSNHDFTSSSIELSFTLMDASIYIPRSVF
jgi:hypothetical protein